MSNINILRKKEQLLNINPAGQCFYCRQVDCSCLDKESICYNCDLCIETRNFITKNNHIRLVYYGEEFAVKCEYWYCEKCDIFLTLKLTKPSIDRDMIIENMILGHLSICDKIKTGRLML
jgi:hypothetical protein